MKDKDIFFQLQDEVQKLFYEFIEIDDKYLTTRKQIENLILHWIKTDHNNVTYLSHKIYVIFLERLKDNS